ncbi:hypothetical protein LOTGIDRAFT_125638, partial [Lottia gigantea]
LISIGNRYSFINDQAHTWNLQIDDLQLSDAGEFTCQVNSGPHARKIVNLNVQGPPKFEKPLPEETMVTEGESLTLTCSTSGSPQPFVTWYEYADQYEKRIVSHGPNLTFPHVTRYDASTFECIAEHSFPPTINMMTDVKVQFAPEIQFLEERLEVQKGSETILKCDVTSYPQAAVMWIKEGKKLFNSLKYRVNVTEETGYTKRLTLTIKNMEESDFGSYVCEARNKVDKTQKTLEVFG